MFNDILDSLRRRNIFGGAGNEVPYNPVPPIDFSQAGQNEPQPRTAQQTGPTSFEDMYSRMMNVDPGPANRQYRDFVTAGGPKREDYSPTKTQRLASILAGVSAGARGANGARVTSEQLDEPFNKAQGDYMLRGRDLETAANLEDKDVGRKVATMKQILDYQDKAADNARNDTIAKARVGNYESLIRSRDSEMKTKGYTATTDMNGNRIYTRVGQDGNIEKIDSGIKVAESPTEKRNNDFTMFGKREDTRFNKSKNLFDYTNPKIQDRSININDALEKTRETNRISGEQRRDKIAVTREQRQQLNQTARDAGNPNRQFARRSLALIEIGETYPELSDRIDYQNGMIKTGKDSDGRVKKLLAGKLGTYSKSSDSRLEIKE